MSRPEKQSIKDEAVRMYLETDVRAATVAEIYGVTEHTFMEWVELTFIGWVRAELDYRGDWDSWRMC